MAENHSTLTLGVAIAAALVVGAALGARSGDKIALASKRLEAQIAEQAAAVDARFATLGAEAAPADAATADAATAEAPQAEDPRVEALGARIDALDAQAATLGGQLARVAVIDDRVTVLAEQMAVMVSQLQALTDAAAETPAAETPAAESAAPAPAASAAAAPAAPSPDDVTLSVGQTATFGETPVFLSRVDVAAREAFVVVVGRGPASVGDSAGALALDDGCALRLVEARDRSAVLARVCAQ